MGDSKNWSNFAAKQALTMEQKFGKNSIDIEALREFCEREGKEVTYRKGDQLEREGDPARWFGFVTEGCFKYVTYGISDDREHITWFSFEGEFAGDYPAYIDLHRATARERYELLLQRCPGIVEHLALQDLASFLNVTPKTISMIRKDITFGKD